jgi:NADPH:quinone reductase
VIGSVRGWSAELERGITARPVLVYDSVERDDLIKGLEEQLAQGVYTLRVAQVLPAEQAEQAHRKLEAGGIRGRLVLDFS